MIDGSVTFEQIEIALAPGIPRGSGFAYEQLSRGINIIHGPNGSGKSTTIRVIQELLWSGCTGIVRPCLMGRFRHHGHSWTIDIDAGFPTWRCDGQIQDPPDFGSPQARHRYHLALHELVHEDNAVFAKVVADASQGGFDLDAAAKALGFRDPPAPRSRERREFVQYRKRVEEARNRQRMIANRAQKLTPLMRQKDQAVAAADQLLRLREALDYRDAVQRCESLSAQLEALPPKIGLMNGDEQSRIDELVTKLAELESQREQQQRRIDLGRQQLSECNLPEAGLSEEDLRRLKGLCRCLRDQEQQVTFQRQKQDAAWAQAQTAKRRIGERLSLQQLEALETIAVNTFSEFARKADRLRAQREVLATKRAWLSAEDLSIATRVDLDVSREGLIMLGRWLATGSPAEVHRRCLPWALIVVSGALVLSVVLLAVMVHPLWVVLVPLAPALLMVEWMCGRAASPADLRGAHRHAYERSGLPQPGSWEVDAVADQMVELARSLASQTLAERRGQLLLALQADEDSHERQTKVLANKRAELEQRLGVQVDVADEWLPVFVNNLIVWQQHSGEVVGIEASLQKTQDRIKLTVAQLNQTARRFGYEPVDSAALAQQIVDDLSHRQARRNDALNQIRTSVEMFEGTIEPELAKTNAVYKELFTTLGLEPSDQATVDRWLVQRPVHVRLLTELIAAQAIRDHAAEVLAGYPHLIQLSRPQIEDQVQQLQRVVNQRDRIAQEIADINSEIELAKQTHDLAEALREEQVFADKFCDVQESDCQAVVGALLVNYVREVSADRDRPEVFKRSSALLAKITRGRFRLELDDTDGPAFATYDETQQIYKKLEELSIGERVQLLLSVRVGFIEQEEHDTQLPLLMDEILGTSDDERAGAIIDAVLGIAREGRQVFYFTAQNDEVGKWVGRLQAADVPYCVVDLSKLRGNAMAAAVPLRIVPTALPETPVPGGMSHEEYGRALGVPGLSPECRSIAQTHLWHVIEEPDQLFQLLHRGVSHWGQLQALIRRGGLGLINGGQEVIERAQVASRAIEAACCAWRVGRARQIDRSVLLESGCVSAAFVDAVCDLAVQLDGDASALLEALESNKIARWRVRRTDQLRQYLEEGGFVDRRPRLSRDDIRIAVLAAVAGPLHAGRIEQAWIDRMVASLSD